VIHAAVPVLATLLRVILPVIVLAPKHTRFKHVRFSKHTIHVEVKDGKQTLVINGEHPTYKQQHADVKLGAQTLVKTGLQQIHITLDALTP
jgi:membrane protein YdbS with pleckstrin-like domain